MRPIIPILLLFVLSSCTTLEHKEYGQPIAITSSPSGADVYFKGKLLGKTPQFVKVRRSRHDALLIYEFPDGIKRSVLLNSTYRWKDSFFSNLVFVTLAPIGWLLDWTTGTAYDFAAPPELRLTNTPASPLKPKIIAVAPPLVGDPDLADSLGQLVADRLQYSSKVKVLQYETTTPVFEYYGSDNGLSENKTERVSLFYNIQADHVLLSRVDHSDDSFLVTGELVNVFSEKTVGKYNWRISGDASVRREFSRRRWMDSIHILPNTVFINLSDYSPSITVGEIIYEGHEESSGDFTDQALRYISTISVDRVDRPRKNVLGRWTLDFIPAAAVSKKNLNFQNYTILSQSSFERWFLAAGYGAEIGYLSRYGKPYLSYVPNLSWTHISYSSPLSSGSQSNLSVGAILEIGYRHFISDQFIAKVFVKSFAEDQKLWRDVFTEAAGQTVDPSGMNSIFTGIAIGYYIPSRLKPGKTWKVR